MSSIDTNGQPVTIMAPLAEFPDYSGFYNCKKVLPEIYSKFAKRFIQIAGPKNIQHNVLKKDTSYMCKHTHHVRDSALDAHMA